MYIDNSRLLALDRDARSNRYYRNAVERHWDPADIDLGTDRTNLLDHLQAVDDTEDYFDGLKMGLARFGAGEQAVTEDLAPLAVALDDVDDQLFVTTQLYEEAKHTDHFDRYWREVVHPVEETLGLERSSPTADRWFNGPYVELFERDELAMETPFCTNSEWRCHGQCYVWPTEAHQGQSSIAGQVPHRYHTLLAPQQLCLPSVP